MSGNYRFQAQRAIALKRTTAISAALFSFGASGGTRMPDPLFTKDLLCPWMDYHPGSIYVRSGRQSQALQVAFGRRFGSYFQQRAGELGLTGRKSVDFFEEDGAALACGD